ncbi:Proteinase inhibitor I25 [Hirschfeldia incana]|nr:Proteinase inhibitor I25 [Hirschfeldia incana]
MAESVLAEVNARPLKIPRYHGALEGASKSINKKGDLKRRKLEDDEYVRQYIQFHYQFQKSEGFAVDWDQFDYSFYHKSLDNPPRGFSSTKTGAQIVREVTLLAIGIQNEAKGTNLVLVEHIQANFQFASGLLCWLSFWAMDMNSSTPESKIYQAKLWRRGKEHELHLFRLKPTDEEIASVEVEPPSPIRCEDSEEEAVVFARAGPEHDLGLPFVFHRNGGVPFGCAP